MIKKQLFVQITKSPDSDYDARFCLSSSSPDRVKDTIDPEAYKPNLSKSLICLWQHQSDQPIGYWSNLEVKAGKLIGDLKVATTNLGLMVKQLISDGVPLGASIGFQGRGEQNKIGGIHFTELELMECSVVSVPCHRDAMRIAKQYGIDIQSSDEDATKAVSGLAQDAQDAKQRASKAIIAAKRTLKRN